MRFKAPRLTLLAAALLATAGLEIRNVSADENKAEPGPNVSAQKNSNLSTNSQSFKPRQNGLKQLEQDLFKPFDTIAPKGALDGAFAPPMPEPRAATPSVQNKRAKELLERRRDWAFETPEEILSTPSTDDMINGRDHEKNSDEKAKTSPMERFYERLYNKDKREPTRSANKRDGLYDSQKQAGRFDQSQADDDSDLPLSVREAQREMKKLLAPKERKEDSSADSTGYSYSDVFRLGKITQSPEEIEMQRERMDRYRELVGIPVTPRLDNDPLKQFRDMVGTSPKNPGSVPTMDSMGGLPQRGVFGSAPGATFAPNASLLPQGAQGNATPSLAPALPKIEPPRTLPPPVTFSAPRRQF